MVANQERFMEILTGLFEFAQSNGGVLEKSKVEESFSEMELSREQYDMIYRYLFGKKITIKGIMHMPSQEEGEKNFEGEPWDSGYLSLYYSELEDLEKLTEEEALCKTWEYNKMDIIRKFRSLNAPPQRESYQTERLYKPLYVMRFYNKDVQETKYKVLDSLSGDLEDILVQ